MLTKDTFMMVSEGAIGLEHFKLHPVWARYYEPDDALIAESWGVPTTIFQHLLDEHHDGTLHAMFPVLVLDPLPDCLDLTLLAFFNNAQGVESCGCISGDGPRGGMYIELFGDDQNELSFNTWPTKDANQWRVLQRLPESWRDRFPIQFTTGRKWNDGTPMAGELILSGEVKSCEDTES